MKGEFYKPLIVIYLVFLCNSLNAQEFNRACIWYFGRYAGLNFNNGNPYPIYDGQINDGTLRGNTSMCDTSGNILFYSNGKRMWNKDHTYMSSTATVFPGSFKIVSFPKPGSDYLFYVFSVPYYDPPVGTLGNTYYRLVDMTLNGGHGDYGELIDIEAAWDAACKITATKHDNKEDIWVITRKYVDDKYAAFLITSDSVNLQPIISPAPVKTEYPGTGTAGQMKVSYNKKYLINCDMGGDTPEGNDIVEVCKFNCSSGVVDYLYSFQLRDPAIYPHDFRTFGVEFSPDSKLLYLSANVGADSGMIYQFDMQDIEDSVSFLQSKKFIGMSHYMHEMQLGRDGRIYIAGNPEGSSGSPYLAIINKPWEIGSDCDFDSCGISLDPGLATACLPNLLNDYLYRFDFDGICESDTFAFDPWFFPEPDLIQWNFGDPLSGANNTSTTPHARHKFTDGGTYEVSVYVEYPSGRIEETSREVEVEYAPEPNLGPDTTFCSTEGIVLDAECGPHLYSWSTGAFGTSQITVQDTGWFWVRVENDAGCVETDSIHLASYPPALADTTNLQVSPTTCGGSTGAVRGLQLIGTPPFAYAWTNDMGDTIATSPDIFHLPVGNYTIHVSDGNGCTTPLGPFTIHDAGDVLIEDVMYSSEYCGQQNGSITVTATSGLAQMLFYSLDNGNTYFSNQGIFTGLSAGSYAVRVKDSSDCQDVYIYNPIIIENIPGPQIDNVVVTPSVTGQNNGAIEIAASGSGDTLYYSNDNGSSFQINNGWFTNLAPGFYNCIVMDNNGCDTTFIVEVTEETILRLQAIAGDDEACPGNSAFVPLIVTNFQDVAIFRTNLLYNNSLIECQGFANANAELEDSLEVIVYPAEGRIELSWSSTPVTLPQQSILTDLVFSSTIPGINQVEWDGQPGSSYFLNSLGDDIPVDYYMGNVKIYNEVSVALDPSIEACEGDDITIMPQLLSSNGEASYRWTWPGGDTSNQQTLGIGNIQVSQSGTYLLSVTDTALCQTEAQVNISVYEYPVPAFYAQDTIIAESPVEIDAGQGFASYLWSSGQTGRFITAAQEGWYAVTIESMQGCTAEDSVYVRFTVPPPEPQSSLIFLPNAFSPDGDGLNDAFRAITSSGNIASFHMYIYNRWGVLVFESHDISQGWDGNYNSDPAPSGAYVYKIEYTVGTTAVETISLTGTVVLIR